MPAYNAEKYIAEAVDSILGQTFGDFEFIILNDCSTDRTEEIILSYDDPRIVYLKNEQNMGVAATLNRGLEIAKGEYIARMDADDISLPERFALQTAYLDTHPQVAVVGSSVELFGSQKSLRHFSETSQKLKVDLLFGCCFAHPSVMMRITMITGLHGYDPAFNGVEDYHLWARVSQKYDLACLPQTLLRYRIHPNQITQTVTPKKQSLIDAIKALQLKDLGLPIEGEEFWAFCNPTADNLQLYAAYAEKLCGAARGCDHAYLRLSVNSIFYRMLDRMPFPNALSLSKSIGLNAVTYGIKRLTHRMKHTVSTRLQTAALRRELRCRDFTILSNNCWGGMVYQKYGLPYQSPTVGLYIPGDDFVKFCSNWAHYTAQPLAFIPWEKARLYPHLNGQPPYPVAKLADIEIYFMHYATEQEAREKWERRAARINPDKLLFKLSQRECCTDEDVARFLAIPHPHKLCFSYSPIPGAIYIPELRGLSGDESAYLEGTYDEIALLNRL